MIVDVPRDYLRIHAHGAIDRQQGMILQRPVGHTSHIGERPHDRGDQQQLGNNRTQRKNQFGVRLVALGERMEVGDQRQRRRDRQGIPRATGSILKPQSAPPSSTTAPMAAIGIQFS